MRRRCASQAFSTVGLAHDNLLVHIPGRVFGVSMVTPGDFFHWLSSLPLIGRFIAWVVSLPALPWRNTLEDLVDASLRLLGLSGLVKWIYRRAFGYKKIDIYKQKIELQENEIKIEHAGYKKVQEHSLQ